MANFQKFFFFFVIQVLLTVTTVIFKNSVFYVYNPLLLLLRYIYIIYKKNLSIVKLIEVNLRKLHNIEPKM